MKILNHKRIILISITILVVGYLLFTLGAKILETGTLQVFSEEEDVYIYINGYLKGKNSVIKRDIQIGEHYVKAVKGKKDGPTIFSSVVRVKKDEVKTVVVPKIEPTTPPPNDSTTTTTTSSTSLATSTTTTTLPKKQSIVSSEAKSEVATPEAITSKEAETAVSSAEEYPLQEKKDKEARFRR